MLSQQCRVCFHTSIYAAELLVIKSAIDNSLTRYPNSDVIVFDSCIAIQAFLSIGYHHPIVNCIRDLVISREKLFNLCWVPRHLGVLDNDQADEFARRSIVDLPVTPFTLLRSDIKILIKNKIRSSWRMT